MEKLCPLLKEVCIEFKCKWFIHLLGKHPQTDAVVDEWDCAISWLPIMLIENSQQTRQAGAAIESFRNEMVRDNEQTRRMLAHPSFSLTPQLEELP